MRITYEKIMKNWRVLILIGLLAGRTAQAATFNVNVQNFNFSPNTLSIGTGNSVQWTLVGGTHTSTSATSVGGCTASGLWDSGTLGSTFTHTFPTAGTFPYFCTFHCASSGMTGTITVTNPAAVPPSVSITNPANNAAFAAPANVTIQASASSTSGSITNVQFFSGANLLGNKASPPFNFTDSSLAAGNYSFTARAFDNSGLSSTSAPVVIFVETNAVLSAPRRATNGLFQFTVAGIAGQTYIFQASSNITTWIPLATNVAPADSFIFTDSASTNFQNRVYRARQDL
jgi:plastocyanin